MRRPGGIGVPLGMAAAALVAAAAADAARKGRLKGVAAIGERAFLIAAYCVEKVAGRQIAKSG